MTEKTPDWNRGPHPRGAFLTEPGARIGRFVVQEELARGGHGVVVRARDKRGEQVAIKLLIECQPALVARFLQEAGVLERLRHPNLPEVVERGDVRSVPYLAMELVEGLDLAAWVRAVGVPAPAQAVNVLTQVAAAVGYIHARGLIHRDLKPQNVILCARSGRAKLVDFGMVKRDPEQLRLSSLDDGQPMQLSETGELKGTPAYMSPEQIDAQRHGEVGPHTDIYGLGCLLFYLLTGKDPYRGQATLYELLEEIVSGPSPDPRELAPDVPPALAEVCRAAMATQPGARYASAEAFAGALRRAQGSRRLPLLLLGLLLAAGAGLALALTAQSPRVDTSARVEGRPAPASELEAADDALRRFQPKRALEHVEAVLARAPSPRAHALHAQTLIELGRADEALAAAERALAEEPDEITALLAQGRALTQRGETQLALSAFEAATRADPSRSEAHWRLGGARLLDEDMQPSRETQVQARAELDRALELDPEDVGALVARAGLFRTIGELERAEADLRAAEALAPEHPSVLHVKGIQLLQRGDPAAALALLERVIEAEPGRGQAYVFHAAGALELGRVDVARADLARADALLHARHPLRAFLDELRAKLPE